MLQRRSPSRVRAAYRLTRDTWLRYDEEHGEVLSAGLAFYGLVSAAPLGWLAVTVASWILEDGRARQALLDAVRTTAGGSASREVAALLSATQALVGGTATWIAAALLLWAASRLFVQIQTVLNAIWGVRLCSNASAATQLKRLATKRVLSFAMVLACGVLLLSGVMLHALASAIATPLLQAVGVTAAELPMVVLQDAVLCFVLVTLSLAAIYRTLPDARIPWADVWTGAAITALWIAVGTFVLSWYVVRAETGLAHGALGSMAAFVLWLHYLCQVFVFGAAFTRVWAARSRGEIVAESYAELT